MIHLTLEVNYFIKHFDMYCRCVAISGRICPSMTGG